MKSSSTIKPQDVLLLLKLVSSAGRDLQNLTLSQELRISPSEISHGLLRLRFAGLIGLDKRTPLKNNVSEFLIHGLKYIYPIRLESLRRGIPTAHSAPPLSEMIKANEDDQYVWPHSEGNVRGQSIAPIYPTAPDAALKDPLLYELLSLCDALRIGKSRERSIATAQLKKRLLKKY